MSKLLGRTKLFWNRRGATILTCVGSAGVIATTVMAVKATPKALQLIDDAVEEKGSELTRFELVKTAGPAYITTAVMGATTISCIFGANVLNKRHQAALTSAYALLNTSYKEYKAKVLELYGEEGEQKVRTELAQDKFEEQEVKNEDDGKLLFYDEYSQRFFKATSETVLRAKYEINKEVTCNYYATMNELYALLDIPPIADGEKIGWSSTLMYEMYWTDWVDFWTEQVELEDGTEYYILHYTEPFLDFEDY